MSWSLTIIRPCKGLGEHREYQTPSQVCEVFKQAYEKTKEVVIMEMRDKDGKLIVREEIKPKE